MLLLAPAGVLADGPVTLQSMCTEMASWTPKQLEKLGDRDVEKFLCVAAKADLRAASTQDMATEKLCHAGVQILVTEFKRRFPKREASEVIGKC